MSSRPPLFSKQQLVGSITILLAALAVVIFINIVPQHAWRGEPTSSTLDSLWRDTMLHNQSTIRLQVFDPNTADSATFSQLGLRPWQIKNIMKYRQRKGRYYDADDFSNLYGLSDSAFQVLRPYIKIDTLPFVKEREQYWQADSLRRAQRRHAYRMRYDSLNRADSLWRDSLYQTRNYHVKRDTILELNSADTSALLLLKGIGQHVAKAIVYRRNALGGYVSLEQLRELNVNLNSKYPWDSIMKFLYVCPDSVHPILVNHCSLKQLTRHPYLSYPQAEAIYNMRRRRIRIRSMEELKSLECMNDSDIMRLQPYLSFTIQD